MERASFNGRPRRDFSLRMPAMSDVTPERTGYPLVIERVLDASPQAVWRCLTEPALLMRWFCPQPWYVSEARMDLRPGGEFYTLMNGPHGERVGEPGVFLVVEPMRRLVFTDAFRPGWIPSGHMFMTGEFAIEPADEGRTHYTGCARHWSQQARERHEAMGFHEGWAKAADQLEAVARSLG
jgi:uncharacterized protein YndB with AHSA1/START domain